MIFGWLFKQHDEIDRLQERVRVLEDYIGRSKVTYVAREEENCRLRKELQLQRVLIDALRNVNASLDVRCNELEKVR